MQMKRSMAIAFAVALFAAAGGLYTVGWALARPVPVQVGPAPAELEAEAVAFPSQSGSVIHGWLSRPTAARASVLLLPGVRANRLSMVRRAEFLRRAGYATLLIDFQATGESVGEAITFGWRERFDVLAAVQYLNARMPGQPVAVLGVSLGGAATLLATPPLEVQAAVLEAVYPSIDRAIVNRLRMRIGPFAHAMAPLLLVQLRPRLGVAPIQLKPVDHIARLGCPLLVVGGTFDEHTTVDETQLLYAAAVEPKELWLIPNAAHVDFLEFAGDDYRRRILAFLAAALSEPAKRQTLAESRSHRDHHPGL
jgi:alpha-beta hydrolase superfamily lysophospholipase